MLFISEVVGDSKDSLFSARLHNLAHVGAVEYVHVRSVDLARRRFRTKTDRGRECGIALARDARLFDGAILHMAADVAIVTRVGETRWLALTPSGLDAGIELGYHAGNLHWRVRFDGPRLLVGLDSPVAEYIDRLLDYLPDSAFRWEVLDGVD